MPRVGSSKMNTRASVISSLEMTTFCWLPPERLSTSWSTLVILILNLVM